MKNVSNGFKQAIKKFGKEIDIQLTYENSTIDSSGVYYFNLSYDGGLLKSVMKKLEIEVKENIPLETIINAQVGLKVSGSYEYIDYGNFEVYSSEKKEDSNTYRLVCYDKMLKSMQEYDGITGTFPMTLGTYLGGLCQKLSITCDSESFQHIYNGIKVLESDPYLTEDNEKLGFTFRDIFDDIAEATASVICVDEDDELVVRYFGGGLSTIEKDSLKDTNVDFGEYYGPINSVVLTRSEGADSIYKQYDSSISQYGLWEIKIEDNQIMNGNDRDSYLSNILYELNHIGRFYMNDYKSTGILYLELGDKYRVKIDNKYYPCLMYNDEIIIDQGLEENVFTERPDNTETDYKKSDITDRKINQAYLIVDKQKGEIQGYVKQFGDYKQTNDEELDRVKTTADSAYETTFELTKDGGTLSVMQSKIDNAKETTINKMVTIDINGINVSTNQSAISTLINNEKFVVMNEGNPLAFFGYDSEDDTTKAYLEHLTVNTYFIAGYHRIEKMNINGEDRTGWFYVG